MTKINQKKQNESRAKKNRNETNSLASQKRSEGVVRIVGGIFKRTPISIDDRFGLRPTPERVRETVFDWLNHLLGGLSGCQVCDMFAGSGAMGLEAVSRGAEFVLSIEKEKKTAKNILSVVEKLHIKDKVQVLCADALIAMKGLQAGAFDVIFIDPPFALNLQAEAVRLAKFHLAEKGLIYVESDKPIIENLSDFGDGLTLVRSGKAGQVYYVLLGRS